MADLYGTGCGKCNKEIAAFLAEGPHMPGYLRAEEYAARYRHLPMPWPKPYVDGEHKERTTATVAGDDGWLLALHADAAGRPGLCACGSDEFARDLWRGKVELR